MLKKRDLSECGVLYELMTSPNVFPYVRHKAQTPEEYLFLTKQAIEAEESGFLISRTILDEWGQPMGTISLFDVEKNHGFLGTWIGEAYFGKGYNQRAKEAFFNELFHETAIQTIFLKIRTQNTRSQKAALKLPYLSLANETHPEIFTSVNQNGQSNQLYVITKDAYLTHQNKVHLFPGFIDERKEA